MSRPASADGAAAGGRLADHVALVTGASRGLGAAVARRLAGEGAHVVLVARTKAGLEEVDDSIRESGGTATLVPLDLTDFDAIDRLGQALFARYRRLDVLVANAAMLGTLTPMALVAPAEWDRVLALNLTANWRLIRSLDPLLRAAPAGRAVFVTAEVARRPRAYWAGYAVSKAALESMVATYAIEVAHTNLRVNLVDPGRMRTGLRAKAFPGEDPASLPSPEDLSEALLALALPDWRRHGETVVLAGPPT